MSRPLGVSLLSGLFAAGAAVSLTAILSLVSPGGWLEPMWRLNPRARTAFAGMGGWGVVLLSVICTSCLSAAVGLWRGARWGHRVALAMIIVNLVGDAVNVVLGIEPRAVVGLPIAGAILAYLASRRARRFFETVKPGAGP